MDLNLRGRRALVTGANSGIGRAIGLALAGEGARVCINYVTHPDAAQAVVSAITAAGGAAIAAQADVADPAQDSRARARSGLRSIADSTPRPVHYRLGTGGPGVADVQYLQTRVEIGPGDVIVVASGEVDLGTTSVLANAIAEGFASGSRVIVDLSDLRHLDASGIRVLLGAARAHGSRLVVVVSNPAIRRLFDILDLKGVVAIAPSLPAAREYLRNR